MVPLSVLDLSPIVEGHDAAYALRNTLDLARHAERWGFRRYWLAEHHAGHRQRGDLDRHRPRGERDVDDPRRRGRHHAAEPSPLAIAEQFGTLESLYPGRSICPGGRRVRRPHGARAAQPGCRRGRAFLRTSRLIAHFRGDHGPVQAVPGAGLHV
jgi:hypothetical protein